MKAYLAYETKWDDNGLDRQWHYKTKFKTKKAAEQFLVEEGYEDNHNGIKGRWYNSKTDNKAEILVVDSNHWMARGLWTKNGKPVTSFEG